jgi:hypothetical protein
MSELLKEKLELLKKSKQNILDKNFKIYFFMTETEIASAAIYEVYNQVKILREIGYDAIILTDKNDFKKPEFLDEDLKALPHISSEGTTFNISPEDYIIIPELFVNIMEQVKKLPCEKILLLQNFENALRGLLPGSKWSDYNIRNVITTNNKLADLVTEYFGKYDVKVYTIGIPDYFKLQAKPKTPVISFYARNGQEIEKVIKLFYLKYPQYRFISFEDLRGTSRDVFAKKIADSIGCLWIDRIASFGTTPIEAMKVKTVPIGLIPDIIPTYINNETENGFWVNDIYQLPDAIFELVKHWTQNAIPDSMYNDMEKTANTYNMVDSKQSVIESYTYFIDKRINEIQFFIDDNMKNLVD